MRPSTIKSGTKLSVATAGCNRVAYFVRRVPARGAEKAVNFVRFPDFAGQNGPGDDGTCQMSDYEISRRAGRA